MFAANVNFRVVSAVLRIHVRGIQTNDSLLDGYPNIENRNPRNLEFLRIARRPAGWTLEKPGRDYWHKLVLIKSSRYITIQVHHFQNGPVISASTKDWDLKKQLYKPCDTAAYINLGRLVAQRCLESGITSMMSFLDATGNTKLNLLLHELEKCGIALKEPKRILPPNPWDKNEIEKPWEIPP